jgi:hypothetical protein
MRSAEGPVVSAMIRCPAGHWFNGTIESLAWDRANEHDPATAAAASGAAHGGLARPDGRDSNGGVALPAFPRAGAGRPPLELRSCLLPGAARPSLASPPSAAAAPHPALPCKPLPVAASEFHLWAALSLAQGPEPHS